MMVDEWENVIQEAWEENRRDYHLQISGLKEFHDVKIMLRNFADWTVEVAIRTELARHRNHNLSAAVFQHVGMPDIHYSGLFDIVQGDPWQQTAAANKAELLHRAQTHEASAMVNNLYSTIMEKYELLTGNMQWYFRLLEIVYPAEE